MGASGCASGLTSGSSKGPSLSTSSSFFSGTTAVTCHLQGDELSGQVTITTAWAGDSRAVLAQVKPCGGVVTRDLSVDQKPERPDEKARIEKTALREEATVVPGQVGRRERGELRSALAYGL